MTTSPELAPEDHTCAGCGISYTALGRDHALDAIHAVPARVRAALHDIPSPRWRTHPLVGQWSVAEYVCHVRDVYATAIIRLHRTRTEHHPTLEPMLNDLRARHFGYNELDLAAVLTELSHNVAGLRTEAAKLTATDWTRTASRRPGETRSALWLLRQAAHEGQHHIADIIRIGAADSDP